MGMCFSRERGCLAVSLYFGWAGFGSLTAAKEIRGSAGKIPAHAFAHHLGQLLEALP